VTLDRRQFLHGSGAALFALALAACTKDKPKAAPGATTTTLPAPPPTAPGPTSSDLTLLRTAASLEALAVSVYQRAAAANLVKDPAALDATTLFLSHHTAHLQAVNALLEGSGQTAVTIVVPPVRAVHSSSVTNGITGWSSRSSRSSR